MFAGPENVQAFRMITIKHGLKLFAKTGMKPNRAWTLKNMLRAASESTGTKYPNSRKGAMTAYKDLDLLTRTITIQGKEV